MSDAAPSNVATRRLPRHLAAHRPAATAATYLAAAALAGCGGSTHRAPPAPRQSPLISESAATREASPADEPAARAGVTVRTPSGSAGRGALARRLPLRFRGWHLSLAQISAKRGAYLVAMLPPPGRRATPSGAARVLRAAAHACHDDPGTYRPVMPMSALAGAHLDAPR